MFRLLGLRVLWGLGFRGYWVRGLLGGSRCRWVLGFGGLGVWGSGVLDCWVSGVGPQDHASKRNDDKKE